MQKYLITLRQTSHDAKSKQVKMLKESDRRQKQKNRNSVSFDVKIYSNVGKGHVKTSISEICSWFLQIQSIKIGRGPMISPFFRF